MPFDPTAKAKTSPRELAAKLPASMSVLLGPWVGFEINRVACQHYFHPTRVFFLSLSFLLMDRHCGGVLIVPSHRRKPSYKVRRERAPVFYVA